MRLLMNIIICTDDNNGILFNHRRQSQDKKVREYILNLVSSSSCNLWMNSYTKKQFKEDNENHIIVDENFLDKDPKNDYCFVENADITPYIDKIEKIILFKWNRIYPTDTFFPVDLSTWVLEESEEFIGYSHEKITKEIYRK